MKQLRIVVVDDSVVVRRIICDVLSGDPEIEVVGTAANGQLAIQCVKSLKPDLVTLDIEMPVMNGLEALATIRKLAPRLPVIMVSTLTEKGASATLDALALGANDYVTKPTSAGTVVSAQQALRDQLVPQIKALCAERTQSSNTHSIARPLDFQDRTPTTTEIVVIGVSTGGPNALNEVLPALPADFPIPIIVVQHMPAQFTKLLAQRLDNQCELNVEEGADGRLVLPGHIYIAPGDFHMRLDRDNNGVHLALNQDPKENSCRPAVDVSLRSAVDIYGSGTLAVIMTGMGQDGLRGCEHAHKASGQIIAQDEATSVVWGMPGAIARAGLADRIVPLNAIADQIIARARFGRTNAISKGKNHVRCT